MDKISTYPKRTLPNNENETQVKKFKFGVNCIPNKHTDLDNHTLTGKTDLLNSLKNENEKDQSTDQIQSYDLNLPSCSSTLNKANIHEPVHRIGIHSLSDELLLILLSYMDASDLYNLSRCSERLFNICGDKSLWNKVKATCNGEWISHSYLIPFFNVSTRFMRFCKTESNSCSMLEDLCFDDNFFKCLSTSAPNLRTFILENHTLSAKTLQLSHFPDTLIELRLHGTQLLHLYEKPYLVFQNVDKVLPNIEIVDVSYCQWFHAHSLLALGKCCNLRELRMTGCRNIKDFIPYASIAATFGFKKLEILDMRLTDLVDREITCFAKTRSLKHIYLEKPNDIGSIDDEESVSDICTTSFGRLGCVLNDTNDLVYVALIQKDNFSHRDYTIETLVVRNYSRITDITLKHAEKCLKSLKYLDITGSNCTAQQISIFKANRPEVKLLCEEITA